METTKLKIEKIKPNPKNPRVIRDEKFKKLVVSITEFPEMLSLRPIVVDENMMVLGGNMRLKACKEAGLKEVEVIIFKDLSEEKKKEFLIKDNTNFGEWDYLMLQDYNALDSWGMDLPDWTTDLDENINNEDDFFGSDFLEEDIEKKKDINLNKEVDRQDWEGSYILLMLEQEDYDFLRKSENFILKKTEKENLSDALIYLLKK